jgi:hypothetical protein
MASCLLARALTPTCLGRANQLLTGVIEAIQNLSTEELIGAFSPVAALCFAGCIHGGGSDAPAVLSANSAAGPRQDSEPVFRQGAPALYFLNPLGEGALLHAHDRIPLPSVSLIWRAPTLRFLMPPPHLLHQKLSRGRTLISWGRGRWAAGLRCFLEVRQPGCFLGGGLLGCMLAFCRVNLMNG